VSSPPSGATSFGPIWTAWTGAGISGPGCGPAGWSGTCAPPRTSPTSSASRTAPGWALVGDAGVVMDSITAQGISNALRDADGLAAAVVAGLGGARPLAAALAEHHRRRDARLTPMFDFTVGLTRFPGLRRFARAFFAAVADQPAETQRFLGAFAGVTPIDQYLSIGNVARVLVRARASARRASAARVERSDGIDHVLGDGEAGGRRR